MSDPIAGAYDPEQFRAQGHRVVDQLADYLRGALAGEGPVLPWVSPEVSAERWPAEFPVLPAPSVEDALGQLFARVLEGSNHLHHPRYVGHQVTAPLPSSALAEMVAALLNNGMAVYEMGPVSSAMERAVLGWMASRLGLGDSAGGVLTSGGSAGNLTALLAARRFKTEGVATSHLALLASSEAHYSVARAVQVMGWGEGAVVSVPVDARHRMRPDALAAALRDAQARGRRAIAVVASAASTATGAYDPLPAIADFCARHDLWLHVDGAHGAAAILSDKYRDLVAGIERADSVVWDAHKMLLMPALVTAVLFRDRRHAEATFVQEASYLYSSDVGEGEWWNIGRRTLECTKRMMSLKLYAALSIHGTQMFSDYVTACFDLARRFAQRLVAAVDFEVPVSPECNIVCFRYRMRGSQHGFPGADLDALQVRIRERLLRSGDFYLVETRLPGGVHLRTTLINPFTTDGDLEALMLAIRAAAV